MKVSAVVVAAGKGTRMQAGRNKVYLPLQGKPVLAYSLELFETCSMIDEIILVVAAAEKQAAEQILAQFKITKASHIVFGGESRAESVKNALGFLDEKADLVAVHDGARPLLTRLDLEKVINAAALHDGAILAYPLQDSIKKADKLCVSGSLERSGLWGAMTPQVFKREKLLKAYKAVAPEVTDDAQLVEKIGGEVIIVAGNKQNIKITTPIDLVFAEAILKVGGSLE